MIKYELLAVPEIFRFTDSKSFGTERLSSIHLPGFHYDVNLVC